GRSGAPRQPLELLLREPPRASPKPVEIGGRDRDQHGAQAGPDGKRHPPPVGIQRCCRRVVRVLTAQPAYVLDGARPSAASASARRTAAAGSRAAVVMRIPGALWKRYRSPGLTAQPWPRSSRTAAASSASGTQTPSPESALASNPRAASADASACPRSA